MKGIVVAALLATLGLLPQVVSANTGAGATILNVVTVNYKDASGVTPLVGSAFATVTVDLVASGVDLTAPGDIATPSGTAGVYNYTITSTANGTDIYFLTSNVDGRSNLGVPTIVFKQGATGVDRITLGASVISKVTATNIDIPAGTAADLVVGDVVVIGAISYKIGAISGAGTAASHVTSTNTTTNEVPVTLTLTTLGAVAVDPTVAGMAVGNLVAEQQSFTAEFTGTTSGAGDGTATVTISVGGPAGAGNPPLIPDQTITTFQGANLTITKEVSSDGGLTFGATAAAPGATLTYRITIVNNGAGNATSVVITDPMPAYTTYTAGTAKLDTTAAPVAYTAGSVTALTDADVPATDSYDFGITTANTVTYTAGTIAAAARVVLFYKVTVQ